MRMRKSSGRPEDAIQRAVFQHEKARKAPGTFMFHVPNGGKRKPIEAAIMKGLGVTAGVPDIIAIRAGHTFALELKAEGGKPSEKQIEVMATMEAAGATVTLATGLDAAIAQLEAWGILRGVAT
jgi:hypothetical protein